MTDREPRPIDAERAPSAGEEAQSPAAAGNMVEDVEDVEDVEGADDVVHDEGDELPAELQPALFVGPYVFPNNSRRRIPGVMYLVVAAALVVLWATVDASTAVNGGFLGAAILLAVFGAYCLAAGRGIAFDERDALVRATAEVGVVAGHASAQLGWRGLWSRPTWRVLLYSAETPPATRALVFVDGLDGSIVERIVEDNPEDWSDLVSRRPDR